MPDLKTSVEAAMTLAKNESTRLGLTFGKVKVTTPGQYISRGGKSDSAICRFIADKKVSQTQLWGWKANILSCRCQVRACAEL